MARGGGGRAAEHVGRRTSSCVFADNIAKASIAAYNAALASVPEPARSDAFGGGRQTVLAAVVARDERLDALRVVSLGAGTKFMSAVDIEADAEAGARVRDSHAEVLARRGLKRFLYAQLAAEAGRSHREPSPVATGRKRTREREEPGSFTAPATEPGSRSARVDASQTWSVLERAGERYRVRPSVTFHLYTSSAPCGNATVKRWAKGAKERFVDGLGAFETPPGSDDHGRPSWSAVKEGQIAFLYKKDPGSTASEPSEPRGTGLGADKADETEREDVASGNRAIASGGGGDVARFVPPGASTTGRVLTCSDKLATWSCVGLQGALLASLLTEPVYLASVTVGRKFNQAILRRALCCRVHRFRDPNGEPQRRRRAKETEQAKGSSPSSPSSSFGVRHPSVMCTAVPFDLGAYAEGEGAVFDRREALAWWLEWWTDKYDAAAGLRVVEGRRALGGRGRRRRRRHRGRGRGRGRSVGGSRRPRRGEVDARRPGTVFAVSRLVARDASIRRREPRTGGRGTGTRGRGGGNVRGRETIGGGGERVRGGEEARAVSARAVGTVGAPENPAGLTRVQES